MVLIHQNGALTSLMPRSSLLRLVSADRKDFLVSLVSLVSFVLTGPLFPDWKMVSLGYLAGLEKGYAAAIPLG